MKVGPRAPRGAATGVDFSDFEIGEGDEADQVITCAFDIQEDLEGELELFAACSEQGYFPEASAIYSEALLEYSDRFPIQAALIDSFLRRGSYKDAIALADLVLEVDASLFQNEDWVFKLGKALATIYTEGALTAALAVARAWYFQASRTQSAYNAANVFRSSLSRSQS